MLSTHGMTTNQIRLNRIERLERTITQLDLLIHHFVAINAPQNFVDNIRKSREQRLCELESLRGEMKPKVFRSAFLVLLFVLSAGISFADCTQNGARTSGKIIAVASFEARPNGCQYVKGSVTVIDTESKVTHSASIGPDTWIMVQDASGWHRQNAKALTVGRKVTLDYWKSDSPKRQSFAYAIWIWGQR